MGVYDPSLDTFLELTFKSNTTPYTLTVQPRTPAPQLDGPEDLNRLEGSPVIVVSPKTDNNQGAIFDALVTYLESQPVKAAMDPMLAELDKDALSIGKAPELGEGGRRIRLKLDSEVAGGMFGAGKDVEFEVLYTEDDKNTYWAFGAYPDIMRDYIKRTMKGEGPTLADDPRAAYLKDEQAFSATFTPIDPTYIAEFVEQIFSAVDPTMSADGKDFHELIEKVSADWKKLPASAVRSRMLADDDGLLWEASTPPAVMRMFGDALRAGIETYQKNQGRGASPDPIAPAQTP
jgi:hypothetical protein